MGRLLVLCVALCPVVLAAQTPADRNAITEIRFELEPTGGRFNPTVSYALLADGTAKRTETGKGGIKTRQKGTIRKKDFRRLSEQIRLRGFFELKDSYIDGTVRDATAAIVGVVRGSGTKTVRNVGDSEPQRLWEVQMAIRGVLADVDWEPDE